MKKVIGLWLLLAGLPVIGLSDQVVFQDTFDTADALDINADVASRQQGGLVTASYKKKGNVVQSAIVSRRLHRASSGELNLDRNFAPELSGKSFEFSVDALLMNTNKPSGWASLSLLSDDAEVRGDSPLSFCLRTNGKLVISSGRAGKTVLTTKTVEQLTVLLGKPFVLTQLHRYKFVVTEAGPVDCVAFYVDDVEIPLANRSVDFGGEKIRTISFVNSDSDVGAAFDNLELKVIDTPPIITLGALGFSALLLLVMRHANVHCR